jgi:hypothetical protein
VTQTDVSERVDVDVDLNLIVPCDGVLYTETKNPDAGSWTEDCSNPAEWTRLGHCSKDAKYCTPCKDQVTNLARHGWCRCAECNTILWSENLQWFRI